MLCKGFPPHAGSFEPPLDHKLGQNPTGAASSVLPLMWMLECWCKMLENVWQWMEHLMYHLKMGCTMIRVLKTRDPSICVHQHRLKLLERIMLKHMCLYNWNEAQISINKREDSPAPSPPQPHCDPHVAVYCPRFMHLLSCAWHTTKGQNDPSVPVFICSPAPSPPSGCFLFQNPLRRLTSCLGGWVKKKAHLVFFTMCWLPVSCKNAN